MMWKKLINSKLFYIILSVVIAVVLWGYVVNDVNPSKDVHLYGIPVEFTGVDVLEVKNLVITDTVEQIRDLELKTDWNTAGKLNSENVRLVIDVSSITGPGYYPRRAEVIYPSDVLRSNISIQNSDKLSVEFTVARLAKRTLPVLAKFTGSVADGYQAGEMTAATETVEIRGLESVISQVATAEVVLDQLDMSKTFEGELPVILRDSSGEVFDGEGVTLDVSAIYVIYPISMVKTLPLSVAFVAGGGATKNDISSYLIEPSSISVSGPEEILSGLREWNLGAVDLTTVPNTPGAQYKFPIKFTDEIVNESGEMEATVTLTLTGLVTQEFEVTNIELKNCPEEFNAELITQSRIVVVRGHAEDLEDLFPSQIRIEADLAQMASLGVGRQSIPAKVFVDSSNAGAWGSYNVLIDVKRKR